MSDQTPPDPPNDPYALPPAGVTPPVDYPQAAQPTYPPPPPAGYPAPTYPVAGYPGGQAPKPGPGAFAIVALIAAIIALLISWVPFIGGVAALVALGLGIGAWVSSKKSGRPAGLAVTGTIISIVALLIGIVITIGFLVLVDRAQEADRFCDSVSTTQAEYDRCMEDRVSSWFGVETNQ